MEKLTIEEMMENFIKKNRRHQITLTASTKGWMVDIHMPRHQHWIRTTHKLPQVAIENAIEDFNNIKAQKRNQR